MYRILALKHHATPVLNDALHKTHPSLLLAAACIPGRSDEKFTLFEVFPNKFSSAILFVKIQLYSVLLYSQISAYSITTLQVHHPLPIKPRISIMNNTVMIRAHDHLVV